MTGPDVSARGLPAAAEAVPPRDDLPTVACIALVAYLTADVIHHAVGHGGMCLAQGGQIGLLSSILLVCSRTGTAIDLAGPFANLLLGGLALLALNGRRLSASGRLFAVLCAGFNLFWFCGQLVSSVVTGRDDWAWMLHELGSPPALRYGLAALGAFGYVLTIRHLGARLAPFAGPPGRLPITIGVAWLAAGVIAAATAAFDREGIAQVWRVALPQSLLLPAGLLLSASRAQRAFVPAPSLPTGTRAAVEVSWGWLLAAVVLGIASIVVLGRGIGFSG